MALTPMMRQYLDIKENHKDAILFFRLGDFYEMFFDDAKLVSSELDLVLTGKDCGLEERAPMCGVPFHSADGYISRLVARGHKVVICEQTEDPALAKGLVRRDVIRIVTPGTVIESSYLDENRNNYLCAAYIERAEDASLSIGVAFADASTGDIRATELIGQNALQKLLCEIGTYSPRELLLNLNADEMPAVADFMRDRIGGIVDSGRDELFDYDSAKRSIEKQLSMKQDDSYLHATRSVGALIKYILETQKTEIAALKNLTFYTEGQYLEMDLNTRRNLELCETMRLKEKRGSLLWVLDKTRTSMGARLIRKWIEQPLINIKQILRRQGAVEELADDFMLREQIADSLKNVLDLERLLTKIIYGTANARDLKAVQTTLSALPDIKRLLKDCVSDELKNIYDGIDSLDDIYDLLSRSISDEPPFTTREGGMLRDGYNSDVDKLRDIIKNGKGFISKIENEEREKTGIKTLKVGYNRVFGYYIEVSKSNIAMVPDSYIRKQTLTTGERYITQELKDLEATILGAADKINALEYNLFCEIRDTVAAAASRIRVTADAVAALDVYVSLADVAVRNNYVKPDIEYGDAIKIKGGRHPVVEKFVEDGYFVPNDTTLDTAHNRLMLITGPNMAGKSTYMRQVALITVMAQIGSFVPASDASMCIVDKLFTRVGASDDLASGQSTFMLEMTEVAYILKNATKQSLIIYDEIGRGTSTFDGMSIALATAEYTVSKKIGAKTLFATHFHELTELEEKYDGVVNYNIAARKKGDDIMFLRKIVRGAADDSYGIEVAKLAGVPNEIVHRAKEHLRELERNSAAVMAAARVEEDEIENENVTFDDFREQQILDKIRSIDPELLSPRDALDMIYELKKMTD